MLQLNLNGNVVSAPEARITTSGRKYYTFRLANNDWQRKPNDDNTFWATVNVWSENMFALMQHITKGKPIIVSGQYRNSVWKKNDGTAVVDNIISAAQISFINSGGQNNQQQEQHTNETKLEDVVIPTTTTAQEQPQIFVKEAVTETTEDKKAKKSTKTKTVTTTVEDDDDDLPF